MVDRFHVCNPKIYNPKSIQIINEMDFVVQKRSGRTVNYVVNVISGSLILYLDSFQIPYCEKWKSRGDPGLQQNTVIGIIFLTLQFGNNN